ncbi:MAG: hypothetical protein SAJ12_22430 [Jaaginema sp. PMC 1079.18]|nr:hypothetical protein [Jaaginema sp. PMC 1080.18]MEC4853746.1 hypothetical protein [Jaaginema sp. PMC 1079.18]MEC4868888.1 hypothetical protein [Jaaginema sp. PMC 1078.18]
MMLKKFLELIQKRPRLHNIPPKVELIVLGSTALLAAFSAVLLPYRSQYLSARILEFTGYTVGCIAATGTSLKIDTPQKREKREKAKLEDLKTREEKILEREMALEKAKLEANQALQQRETEFLTFQQQQLEQIQAQYEAQISQLRAEIAALNAPQLDPGALSRNNNCNKVIQYIWRQHDIILDWRETVSDPVSRIETYVGQLRNPGDIRKLRDDKLLWELEALLNVVDDGLITVSQVGANVAIAYAVGKDSRETQAKKRKAQRASLYTIEQTVSRSLGYFIAGESGSGKTAIASYLAYYLATKTPTQQEKRILKSREGAIGIVLDVHNNPVWQEVGLPVVYEPLKILDYALKIKDEYRQRKAGKKGDRLIIFVDEFEELLNEVESSFDEVKEGKHAAKTIADTVRMLGSGGRKFALNIIVMNQSWNCTAIKLDGNHRNNFIGIALNANAINYINQKCGSNSYEKLRDWALIERKDKYKAITFGAVSPRPLLHPTHHDYPKIEDGQLPQNLQPIEWLPLSIGDNDNYSHYWETEINFQPSSASSQSPVTPHQSISPSQPLLQEPQPNHIKGCDESVPSTAIAESPRFDSITASQSTAITCPHCGSNHHVKNGSIDGKPRRKCKDCKRTFTETRSSQ